MKGATALAVIEFRCLTYFNPRTREGCDMDTEIGDTVFIGISIHAPVKGATCCGNSSVEVYRYFNPRTREGCDGLDSSVGCDTTDISIHAPVKGATYRRSLGRTS